MPGGPRSGSFFFACNLTHTRSFVACLSIVQKYRLIAGDGGNGCLAFRREKFVPRGGPSGGDGGKGGDVYIECSERVNTLLHFQYKRIFKAQRGRHGEGDNRHGKDGEDVIIPGSSRNSGVQRARIMNCCTISPGPGSDSV